jgi:hypothetical protein
MRISDERYDRDRQRYDLALRFIQHEARTRTIRTWTGLSDDRIRKLCRSYASQDGAHPLTRHRGKSPQMTSFFMQSPRMRQETSILASICYLHGVMPSGPLINPHLNVPGMHRGEILCEAFETYQRMIRTSRITFEHAVFLVIALAGGHDLHAGHCAECSGLIVMDRYAPSFRHCLACASV